VPGSLRVVFSLLYWVLRRLLELLVLRTRSERAKEIEILVLRHQLRVMERQVGRPRLRVSDRVLARRAQPGAAASGVATVDLGDAGDAAALASGAGSATVDVSIPPSRSSGDIKRSARAGGAARAGEPELGLPAHPGELVGLGISLAASTVWAILREAGIEPAPQRAEASWREFLRRHAASIVECDLLTVDTLFLKRFYVLFAIELVTRRVRLCGVTANPDSAWVSQQARNLVMRLNDEGAEIRFLIRDRDSMFTRDLDEVFGRHPGDQGAGAGATGAGARRALGRHAPARVPRSPADPRPPPAGARPPRIRRPLQHASAAPCARPAAATRQAAAERGPGAKRCAAAGDYLIVSGTRAVTLTDGSGSLAMTFSGTRCPLGEGGHAARILFGWTIVSGTGAFAGATGTGSRINTTAGDVHRPPRPGRGGR
jgi:putative transposase